MWIQNLTVLHLARQMLWYEEAHAENPVFSFSPGLWKSRKKGGIGGGYVARGEHDQAGKWLLSVLKRPSQLYRVAKKNYGLEYCS